MLMQVGLVTFDLSFNIDGVSRETVRDYVEKPVIGVLPPMEDMGEGAERLSFSGRLIPSKLGGLAELSVLRSAQATGLPQLVMRGDGHILGFYVIQRISDDHRFLNARGVGQMVDIGIDMWKTGQPDAGGYFSALWSLLG